METRATVPSFYKGLTSFPPRYQAKDQGQYEWSLEKKIRFQLTFHIVSLLILGVSDEKDGKGEEVKFFIFALITEKLKFIKYKQIALMGCFQDIFFSSIQRGEFFQTIKMFTGISQNFKNIKPLCINLKPLHFMATFCWKALKIFVPK